MTETPNYTDLTDAQLGEEIKRARLKSAQAGFADMETAAEPLSDLLKEKVRRGGPARRATWMHRKMHEAAETAEETKVGTGGKGMPSEDP